MLLPNGTAWRLLSALDCTPNLMTSPASVASMSEPQRCEWWVPHATRAGKAAMPHN